MLPSRYRFRHHQDLHQQVQQGQRGRRKEQKFMAGWGCECGELQESREEQQMGRYIVGLGECVVDEVGQMKAEDEVIGDIGPAWLIHTLTANYVH